MGTMRLLSRFRRRGDAPDPELLSIFEGASERLAPDSLEVARARSRVTERFEAIEATGGGLRRRLALATAGGTGMWATLLGTAAANKAAAVALAVTAVAGGGVAVEASGLGADVRSTVLGALGVDAPPEAGGEGAGVESLGGPAGLPVDTGAVQLAEADGMPGIQTFVVTPNGSFVARLILGSKGELLTAGGQPIETADAEITLLGGDSVGPLADHGGDLALVRGTCETDGDVTTCTADSVQIIPAGQVDPANPPLLPSQAGGAGQPEVLPGGAPADPGSQGDGNRPDDVPAGPPLNPSNGPQD